MKLHEPQTSRTVTVEARPLVPALWDTKPQTRPEPKTETKTEPKLEPKTQPGQWDHLDISQAKVMDGFVRIGEDNKLTTKESYSGPLDITTVARTQQYNIRLVAFVSARVIFNWNSTPESCVCIAPTGRVRTQVV